MSTSHLYAADYVLTPGEPLTIDLSKPINSVQATLPDGLWVLRAEQQFAEVAIEIDQAQRSTYILDQMDFGQRPAEAVLLTQGNEKLVLTLNVRNRAARQAHVTIQAISAETLDPLALDLIRLESVVSGMPHPMTDADTEEALSIMRQAAIGWRGIDERRAASAMLATAQLLREQRKNELAFEAAKEAVALASKTDDTSLQGHALNAAGLFATYLRDEKTAKQLLTEAKRLLDPIYLRNAASPASSNLCFIEFSFSRLASAEACYQGHLAIAESAGDIRGQVSATNMIAGTFARRDDPLTTIEYLKAGLQLIELQGDDFFRARMLNNIGIQYRRGGRYQDALISYLDALAIYEEQGKEIYISRVLANIGVVYGIVGDIVQARSYLERAHELSVKNPSRDLIARKEALATAHLKLGNRETGLRLHNEAIAIAKELSVGEATILDLKIGLAIAEIDAGNIKDGSTQLTQLLDDPNIDQLQGELIANASTILAKAMMELGQLERAETLLGSALQISQRVGLPVGTARAKAASSRLAMSKNKTLDALSLAEEAIGEIERLRGNIANPELRAVYQATLIDAYELAIEALMAGDKANGVAEALMLAERFRARTLVDSLMQSEAALTADVPRELQRQRANLQARINRAENSRLRNRPAEDLNEIINELNVLDARIAESDPRLAAALNPPALSIQDLQQQLDENDLALQFLLGEHESWVWAVTQRETTAYQLPPAKEIDTLARSLHTAIETRRRFQSLAAELGDMLLAPVEHHISQQSNITIIADKALNYVPFDVLTSADSSKPVLLDHRLSYQPSLTTLALQRARERTSMGRSIAVLADPVYSTDDNRITVNRGRSSIDDDLQLNRLRMSGREAEAIATLAAGRPTDIRTGHAASAAALRSDAVSSAQIVHIASHGFVNDDVPAKTGLALSMLDANGENTVGFVGLREINQLRLNAELVVLSACDTALGRNLAGEGLLGLTRGFMFAGADRVVASLWQVEDRATAELMEHFYRALLQEAMPPAAALAYAKKEMRKKRQWRHPYYWSGIVLMGDWRGLSN
ncbi:MAG: CHAT domain-containing tetratricopeptide repeat protein [Pseudomonadota bacterium]